jgi:hypothetical protein
MVVCCFVVYSTTLFEQQDLLSVELGEKIITYIELERNVK